MWAAYSSFCKLFDNCCFLQSDDLTFPRSRASPNVLMGYAYPMHRKLRCCSINVSQVVAVLEVCSGVRMRWRGGCRCGCYWRYLQGRATRYSYWHFLWGTYVPSCDILSTTNQFLLRPVFWESRCRLLLVALRRITGHGAACSGRLDYGASLRWFLFICSCRKQAIRIREAFVS